MTLNSNQPKEQKSHTILVIDDQAAMAKLMSLYLEANDYRVFTACSADEARSQLVSNPPDLILLDVLMDDVNGFDLCREIRAMPALMMVPVVLVTTLDSKEDRIRGIEAGCDDFLSKPVHREELRARVRSLLKLQAAHQALVKERAAKEKARRAALRQNFERYVSPHVVEQLLSRGSDAFSAHVGARCDAVALFADMRGFTRMSETLQPFEVVGILNQFFAILTVVAHRHNATVLSMAGDCLLIGFGIPLPMPDIERRAFETARDIMLETQPLVQAWEAEFGVKVGVGIGLNRGDVIAGNIGSPTYVNYTMIGDTVNIAARLTELASPGEIICSESMRASAAAMQGQLVGEREYKVALKGKSLPVKAYGYQAHPDQETPRASSGIGAQNLLASLT